MKKRTVTVTVNEEEIVVEKQGLLTWGVIASKFDTLIDSIFANFENMTEENYAKMIPKMIQENIVSVINILEIATTVPRKHLEEDIDPAEALDLVLAVIEVNNLVGMTDNAKKLISLFKKAQ